MNTLSKTIKQINESIRNGVDGWDFRQYVLSILFYRFASERVTRCVETIDGAVNYSSMTDVDADGYRSKVVGITGFFVLPSELFENVMALAKNNDKLGETLSLIIKSIERSDATRGIFGGLDMDSVRLGDTSVKRSRQLAMFMEPISNMELESGDVDTFGDTYEILMGMYASNAGKSGGEFFTPQEVSELLAEITTVGKTEVNKVYDPACGSGSLLLKFAKVLGKENVRQGFFGQEINLTTYNLCRINMILHGINCKMVNIARGNTLTNPLHLEQLPFDVIVSNPPYSTKWEGKNNPILINDPRFSPVGVLAPPSKADLSFVMHILYHLSKHGTAGIVEFPGVLYRRGAEQKIRQYLIDNNYIDTVIQLPPDLFFGTSIATCIIVLKKSKSDNKTLFIDASAEFIRGGNKNKLSDVNRAKILEAFTTRKDIEYFSKLVDNKKIAENDYNIAISSYVEQEDTREIINIDELKLEIKSLVKKSDIARKKWDDAVAEADRWLAP